MTDHDPNLENKHARLLETIYKPGFSALGHGTSDEIAKTILANGLEARSNDLSQTAVPLLEYDKSILEQDSEIFLKPWPHRNYRYVVIIQIPNPGINQPGGNRYFNSIFESLPDDRKVEVGIQGADKSYYIPSRFIQGYINLDTLDLIENPGFNPPNHLEVNTENAVVRRRAFTRKTLQPIIEDQNKTGDDDWIF